MKPVASRRARPKSEIRALALGTLESESSSHEFAEQLVIKFDTGVLANQFFADPLERAQALPVTGRANLEDLEAAPDGGWDLVDVIGAGVLEHLSGFRFQKVVQWTERIAIREVAIRVIDLIQNDHRTDVGFLGQHIEDRSRFGIVIDVRGTSEARPDLEVVHGNSPQRYSKAPSEPIGEITLTQAWLADSEHGSDRDGFAIAKREADGIHDALEYVAEVADFWLELLQLFQSICWEAEPPPRPAAG